MPALTLRIDETSSGVFQLIVEHAAADYTCYDTFESAADCADALALKLSAPAFWDLAAWNAADWA